MEFALRDMYVILRCIRWGKYVDWMANPGGISDPRPELVRSWWFKVVMVDKVQQGTAQGRRLCPVDILEAIETQRCVKALPAHLRDTLVEEYVIGGTAEEKAQALGIEPRAFRHRRGVAHVELLGLFNDIACGVDLAAPGPTTGRPPVPRPAC